MNEITTAEINRLTTEISILKQQTAQNIIEIGKRLIAVKEMLPHGEWGKWLEEKVEFSQEHARRFMKIAKECSNSTSMLNLPPTKVFALLDLPQDQREEFIQNNPVDEMSTRELQQVVKEKQELERKLRLTKSSFESAIEARNELREKVSNLEADNRLTDRVLRETQGTVKMLQEALQKEKEHTKAEVDRLVSLLNEARSNGSSDEKVKQLEGELAGVNDSLTKTDEELDAALKKIEDIERQLKEKPIEVSATTTIEKIPEEVERELAELREKAKELETKASQQGTATLKFKFYFDSLVKGFSELLNTLAEIREEDPESHDRYKNAVLGLIGKMEERL